MKIAIMESIMTPGGHEVDFDRILVEELQAAGHEVCFYVPENFEFSFAYQVPVRRLQGQAVPYTGVKGWRKWLVSAKREYYRQKWYQQMLTAARNKEFAAIIIPTSTYRYLRALNINPLKNSPVPLIFILHGINPQEAPKFFKEAAKLLPYKNVKMTVLTFHDHVLGQRSANIFPIYPPTYTARDILYTPTVSVTDQLTIGFFGQYRREKRLEDFLDVFVRGQYTQPVKLLVQGATIRAEDAEDFERIIKKYRQYPTISFLHKGLVGAAWQQAISEVDALLMPYSAPRYRYHWGGMLFTALGYQKPVVVSDDINPEVIKQYNIGASFTSGDLADLKTVLESFINNFNANAPAYKQGLQAAGRDFSPQAFCQNIIRIITMQR